jgi:hypothetical protein
MNILKTETLLQMVVSGCCIDLHACKHIILAQMTHKTILNLTISSVFLSVILIFLNVIIF